MKMLLTGLLLLFQTAQAQAPTDLRRSHDLQALGQLARAENKKILLLVSLEDCPWCEKLKEEVLNPMRKAGDFSDALIIAEIGMDAGEMLQDFDGQGIDGSVWASKRGIYTSPTLLFLDADGKEQVKRMLGYNSADLFPYYLEESIRQLLTQASSGKG